MSVAKKWPACKSINRCSDTAILGMGIISHWRYKEISTSGNKPDLIAITILGKLYFVYKRNSGVEFNDGYIHLQLNFKTKYVIQGASTYRVNSSDCEDKDIFNYSSLENQNTIFKNSFLVLAKDKTGLASFHPLAGSGGDFTINAVNEILLKLAKRHTRHCFPNKKASMSYMGKALSYEIISLRDAIQISFALDKNWFSKLEPEINNDNRSITLYSLSDFIKDWVQSKYSSLIEKLCQAQNYSLMVLFC